LETEYGSLFELVLLQAANDFFLVEVFTSSLTLIFLLLGSALISGSEVAFFSLTSTDVGNLSQENNRSSHRILKLINQPRHLLATILISNNFINIGIVIISNSLLERLLPRYYFEQWSLNLLDVFTFLQSWFDASKLADAIGFLITVAGATFLLVLFGEVAPKIYAKLNNVYLSRLMANPLTFLMRFFSLPSLVLVNWTKLIENRLEKRTKSGGASRKDINRAIELTVSKEKNTQQEIDILKSIIQFGDVNVTQIMTSRVDVVAVDFRINYIELLNVVRKSGYSRIPVYENDFDNVTGILYVKDLLGHLNENINFEWQQLIRTSILYVPEAKKIDDLLRDFQRKHLHLAIVVDEYGGSAGIVTLEDILEEIIGEIKDEFDDDLELDFQQLDDYNFLFEGKTLLNDVCRVVGIDTNTFNEIKGESDSLAGLILEICGQMPQKAREILFTPYRFKIVAVTPRRIERILITLPKTRI